ncbi:cobalamin-5'-phosphate synthase [Gemmobacter aquatilis]|uniref:Adenosylcobinamide-GDP ribazoletransferase n=1 Tax=Gemmobacter aquatilis TaxID=933059 RepID=A0A1H8F6R0_9RHOB|nr:adenosylcobinamide-GDP ribazoletransferase [Gemmobacter aquatilis]SEN27290.1 cobalamin-5'-phosphate synthase [Gemmobacter aquatilis]
MRTTDPGDIASRLMCDLRAGLSLLSRVPLPPPASFPSPPAVWAWPVAGLILGGLAVAVAQLALVLGLPVGLAAALALGMGTLTTGAMHEDGLADTCDGLWGGWEKARRLEIMKDSHIGSYGVMGLLLVTLARWSAVSALLAAGHWPALLAAAALSRAPMAVLMAGMANARGSGLSASVGRPSQDAAAAAVGVAAVLALLTGGLGALAAVLAVAAATLVLALLAQRKIGGQTGDILGASQQLADLAALAAFASLI